MEKITALLENEKYRTIALATALAYSGLALLTILLTVLHPAAGEIAQGFLIRAGMLINLVLVAFAAILIVAFLSWNFKKGIRIEYSAGGVALLAARSTAALDISPDVLVYLRPGETQAEFTERAERAIADAGNMRWVVVIPFASATAAIYETPTRALTFERSRPPFQSDEWSDEQKVCAPGTYFQGETESAYSDYIQRFAFYFREWALRVKVLSEKDNPARAFVQAMRASANVALFLLFSAGLFAQKTQGLSAALGAGIREIPAAGSAVVYVYERSEISRIADGKSNYVDLLKSTPMFRDGGGGNFVALYNGNRIVCRASQTEAVANRAEIMRPPATDQPAFSMPDSISLSESLDRAKERVSFYKSEFWRNIRPTWGFVMFAFWAVFPILAVFGLVLWFWARLSASEEMPAIHWHSSRGLVLLVGSTWTIGIINSMLTVVWWELPTVPFLACIAGIGFIAWKTAAWVVPNIHAKPGGRTAFYNNRNNPPLLNS